MSYGRVLLMEIHFVEVVAGNGLMKVIAELTLGMGLSRNFGPPIGPCQTRTRHTHARDLLPPGAPFAPDRATGGALRPVFIEHLA